MIQWGFWCGVGLGCIVGLLSPLLGYLFTADAAVLSLTAFLLIHVALQQPLAGVVFALDGILIGAGNLRFLAVTMWISAVVLVGGGLVVLATGAGIGWLWFCLMAWLLSRAIMLLARFRTPKWQVTGANR